MYEELLPTGRLGSVLNVGLCSAGAAAALVAGLGGDQTAWGIFWVLVSLDVVFLSIFVWVRLER